MEKPCIHYAISATHPNNHLFEITLTIQRPQAQQVLALPVWIPGSYLVREFSKHLQDLSVQQGRRSCTYEQLDKNRWQIACEKDKPVQISYRVYAHDNSVRTAWLDTERGFFNATSLCLMVQGQTDQPHHMSVSAPYNDWQLATGLEPVAIDERGFGSYCAPDYDTLADCPVEMGSFWSDTFVACGIPHRFVIATPPAALDAKRLLHDVRQICEAEIRFWHGGAVGKQALQKTVPFKRYVFMLNAVADGYGGLEHSNSTALLASRKCLPHMGQPVADDYTTLLGLISHEYFHAWNVKRLKPADFVPYDYSRENYTTLLWFFEGLTSYYDDLLLLRAGCIDADGYLKQLQKTVDAVYASPGRFVHTLAQSSFEAWTKFYRPDENTPNATVSYYAKGALFGLCLDLTLRKQGRTTLDAVMRTLYQRYFVDQEKPRGITEEDFSAILHELAGRSFHKELHQWLHGIADLPLEALLKTVGVRIDKTPAPLAQQWGLRCKETHSISVQSVLRGGAAEAAGMAAGDEWLGVEFDPPATSYASANMWRVRSLADVQNCLPPVKHNAQHSFTALVARDQRLLRLPMQLPAKPALTYKLVAVADPDSTKAMQQWLCNAN